MGDRGDGELVLGAHQEVGAVSLEDHTGDLVGSGGQ